MLLSTAFLAASAPFFQVLTLSPETGLDRQVRVASAIETVSLEYQLQTDLLVSIAFAESGFKRRQKNCNSNLTCDHGLMQINTIWIEHYGLDADRLVKDDLYNLRVAGRILSHLRKYYGHEPDWWTRFHSFTPKHRRNYGQKVGRWLAQIEGVSGDNLLRQEAQNAVIVCNAI